MKDYFFCYNKKLSDFLRTKGHRYITVAIDPNTKKIYSLYEINNNLQISIDEYKNLKKY